MMAAYTADRDRVTVADIESSVKELQWSEFAERPMPRRQQDQDPASTGRFGTGGTTRNQPALYIGPSDTASVEAVPDKPLAKLIVVSEGRTVGEIALRTGRLIIGRTTDNDLQIESRFVSRHHCQIITKPNACIVEDLNSTNGIVVKSKRVRRHGLVDGDVITIGKHDLLYIDERGNPGRHDDEASATAHGETQTL
jgi:pSer/pThr/pTyr-binding forkhead associated (FHA) protein